MGKKVLFTANTFRHLYLCHRPYLEYFKNSGYEVHIATDKDEILDRVDKSYKLSVKRNPLSLGNIKAIFELKKILNNEHYDIIHTHTPMGAVITRIASLKARKRGSVVLYTAHGFHFFKGASFINYMLYFPIEKILSRWTDMILTMNKEDYDFAKKHFKTKIKYVPGVGFNEDKFKQKINSLEKLEFRKELGLSKDDYVITYVAEISKRKRQDYLLKVISKMNITNEKFLLVGDNYKLTKVFKLIEKYHLEEYVKVIGFNDVIYKYLDISDLIISVSKQEGLPLNIMEAMYKGKPIIVTDCRGNRDLIKNNVNGLVVPINDSDALINAFNYIKGNKKVIQRFKEKNIKLVKKYSVNEVFPIMEKIYKSVMR